MTQLLLGMLLFFGMHSVSIFANSTRNRLAEKNRLGWMLVYSLVAAVGLYLMIKGYSAMRLAPELLYVPPVWLKHLGATLVLPSLICFVAPYFPGRIKAVLKHPQLVGVKLWATGHLLANGSLGDVLLFGGFLVWAVAVRISIKRRSGDRIPPPAVTTPVNDLIAIAIGGAATAALLLGLHGSWFGVQPFV